MQSWSHGRKISLHDVMGDKKNSIQEVFLTILENVGSNTRSNIAAILDHFAFPMLHQYCNTMLHQYCNTMLHQYCNTMLLQRDRRYCTNIAAIVIVLVAHAQFIAV